MVLIEICYCKITGKTRDLPKVHHFIPIVPWSCKKINGKAKVMTKYDTENDGPQKKFEKKEQIKLVLDMSNEGPMFKMLESMLRGGGKNGDKVYDALNKLLKSGIPGLEGLFTNDGSGNFVVGFSKMSDEDKKRFLAAVTGSGGKIDAKAAAALIAAAASGGDPEIANKIIEQMMAGLGDEIDPAMMAALMATTALVASGASNEEILKAMQRELANSGMSQEEILAKMVLLQKAMAGDNSPAFINKTLKNALEAAKISPDDLSKAVFIEKTMSAVGVSTGDLSALLSLQSALSEAGVPAEMILETIKLLLQSGKATSSMANTVKDSLNPEGVSLEEIASMIALSKGMPAMANKELTERLKAMLNNGKLDSAEAIRLALEEAIQNGDLNQSSLAKTVLVQKVITASGASPEILAKVVNLQKALAESGMPSHEMANALTLAMAMAKADTKDSLKNLLLNFSDLLSQDISAEDLQLLISLSEAMSSGEMPEEVIRLFKKAMKQRRGSVENVAETLMVALAASGESQESIAKAMVRALKATGARPEEIARMMQQALEKTGASAEEIARTLAKAMAESGATPGEIAAALKSTFARALASDPSAAPEIARALAEALSLAGASVEEIAATMREAMGSSVMMTFDGTAEDMLDMAETVAATLAEAGATPAEIASAMKAAFSAVAQKSPEMVEEMAAAMARAMVASGATGVDILKAMQEALSATGASKEEIAQTLLSAMASSRAAPDVIAKAMFMALHDSGLTEEEIQEMVLQSMLEAGATPDEIAKVMVEQKLLRAIGSSPDDMSKSILKQLRSGGKLRPSSIQSVLLSGGIDATAAAKLAMFHKALSHCGIPATDVVRAMLMQSVLVNDGISPENILAAVFSMINECGGITSEKIQKLIESALSGGTLSPDDILCAIKFDSLVESGGVCTDGLRSKLNESIQEAVKEMLKSNHIEPETIAVTALLQKLLSALDLPLDSVAKFFQLEKCLYEGGASPHDIAEALTLAMDKSFTMDGEKLKEELAKGIRIQDIEIAAGLIDSFRCGKVPPEIASKLILLQKAIESGVISPEKSAQGLVDMLRSGIVDPVDLAKPLREVLEKNGLTIDTLGRVTAIEKSLAALNLGPDDLASYSRLQNYLLEAGYSAEEIVDGFADILGGDSETAVGKSAAKAMLAALDNPRLRECDLSVGLQIARALQSNQDSKSKSGSGRKVKHPTEKITDVIRKCLDNVKLSVDSLTKILTFQKVMSVAGCTPQEVSRVVKVLNEMSRSGAPAALLCKTVQETLESLPKGSCDTNIRKYLSEILQGTARVRLDKDSFDFFTNLQTSLSSKDYIINNMKEIFENAMKVAGLTKEDVAKAALVQRALAASGVTPEILAQAVIFQKALAASGASAEEIAKILAQVTSPGFSDEEIKILLSKVLDRKSISKEEIEHIQRLQQSLRAAGLGDARFNGDLREMIASGQVDLELLGKAVLMQKVLSATGLDPEDLGKALLMQKAMLDAGATSENVANCMQKALMESGLSLEELISLMAMELRSCNALVPDDIRNTLKFERVLSAAQAAKVIMKKLNPDELKLLEATVNHAAQDGGASLVSAMKGILGNILDAKTIQAMEVCAAMAAAGASQEDIEEMMAMLMSSGSGGVSEEFLTSIKEALQSGGSPKAKLAALKAALDEELNSTSTSLRNTFMNKIATAEDVRRTCEQLAEKLSGDHGSVQDAKIALVDLLDEALHDIAESDAHPEMLFNYLMISAMAAAVEQIEKNGIKFSGDKMNEMARQEIIGMIKQLLLEADLPGELDIFLSNPNLSISEIQDLLNKLMLNPKTASALQRRVAFLFDFEEVEHTSVLGLALSDIIKDAKHKLKPWELTRHRCIRGLRKSKVPQLTYSQVYCFYKVLPEHTEGPAIGLAYD